MSHFKPTPVSNKPSWFVKPIRYGSNLNTVSALVDSHELHTVCDHAECPNRGECYARGTATLLILGDTCTRNCRFCAVSHGTPAPLDSDEPRHIAEFVKALDLRHVVITSVTRDDLHDGGASHFAETVDAIHAFCHGVSIELLIPDFFGSESSITVVADSGADVIAHNMEAAERIFTQIRPRASYRRSLQVLRALSLSSDTNMVKSGFMLGLGEEEDDILRLLDDIREAGATMLSIGQYLKPHKECYDVRRFLHPDEFQRWRETALEMGFDAVAGGPLVRSSYRAGEMYREKKKMLTTLLTENGS